MSEVDIKILTGNMYFIREKTDNTFYFSESQLNSNLLKNWKY